MTEKVRPPLELPSNATSIRAEITDTFSCENRGYGYYADVDNGCQIFHVCLPVMYADERKERTFRWSFICPDETVFNQVVFTCVLMEDMPIECKDSEQYYQLNQNFGMAMNESEDTMKVPAAGSEMMAPAGEKIKEEQASPAAMQQMIEKIEMTTDSKVIMESPKPSEQKVEEMAVEAPAAATAAQPETPSQQLDGSNIKVVIRPMGSDMTVGLLPPLSNDVYRAGVDGEAEMPAPEVINVAVVEKDMTPAEFDEVKELEEQSDAAVADLKESVVQAVENIIEQQADVTIAEEPKESQMDIQKMRKLADPRGRRFLFRADAKRHY